jgi:small subunit ribosomal protein S33
MAARASNYAKRMAVLRSRIFGEVARPTNSKSMKVTTLYEAKPLELRSEVAHYYPALPQINSLMIRLRNIGLFRYVAEDKK